MKLYTTLMNLNIKATGTREEIAAMLRELATKLETGQTPEGAEESEPIRIERESAPGKPPSALYAETKKQLTIPGHEQPKPAKKKADPVQRAAMCLQRAITKAGELVAALREVFPAATGAAIMVLEDLMADAVRLAQKLTRLDSLCSPAPAS